MSARPSPEVALVTAIHQLVQTEVAAQVAAAMGERSAPSDLMSTDEAAEFARVVPGTIRRWVREGRLAEHRAGRELRVGRADLEQLMQRGRRTPTPPDQSPEARALRDFG